MPIVILFVIYNLLSLLALPLLPLYLPGRIRERLGFVPRTAGAYWLHGASVGEVLSLGCFIDQLASPCIVTSVTATGKSVASRQTNATAVSLLPYDFLPCMLLAFLRIRPKALIVVENDWWPNLLMLAHAFGVPVYVLSARIHKKSFAKYQRMGWYYRPLLARAQHVYVQTEDDKKRFAQLGLTRVSVLGEIKAQNVLAKHNAFTPAQRGSMPTLLVGSLHPGELPYYTTLFVALKQEHPDLRMILAPRHLHWQKELVASIQSLGFRHTLWNGSAMANALENHDIVLVCTLGKLFSLYSHADIFYLGGTFVPVGGHNLLEPAVFGVPTIVGPYYENTKRVATELASTGGVILVNNGNELLESTKLLLESSMQRMVHGLSAQRWVSDEAKLVAHITQALSLALRESV